MNVDYTNTLVEFNGFLQASEEERKDTLAQLEEAFRNVGFVCITDHSIHLPQAEECFKFPGYAQSWNG